MLVPDLFCQQCELSLRALRRGARFQPSDLLHGVSVPVRFVGQGPWNEHVDRRAGRKNAREIEGRGQHTHHRYRLVVQRQRSPHHGWVFSKPPLPQAVAQQRGRWIVEFSPALLREKRSSDRRLHTQQREEVLRNGNARQALRFAGSGECAVAHAIEGEPGQIGE